MRWTPMLFYSLAVFLPTLVVVTQQTNAEEKGEPQMVWLDYTEGEVKFSPGHEGEPVLGKAWLQANVGQVMEEGYTLVTEKGRAEIEFENGTVVYLAGDSALQFNQLWIGARDQMETEVRLLTGTLTIAYSPRPSSEFHLQTPVMSMLFASKETSRIDCALDGVVIKRIAGTNDIFSEVGSLTLAPGESAAFVNNKLVPLPTQHQVAEGHRLYPWWNPAHPPDVLSSPTTDEWDDWVASRTARRDALIAQGLQQSGMQEPIPGLAGMVAGGTFFDCAQYGKCWRENELSMSEQQTARQSIATSAAHSVPQTTSGTRPGPIVINKTMLSRCPMQAWKYTARGRGQIGTIPVQYGPCFAGSWDYATWDSCRRPPNPWDTAGTYWLWTPCPYYTTWVVGRRHHYSCHFHKTQHGIGIVPRHPLDRTGRPPVNAKNGLLTLTMNKGHLQAGLGSSPVKGTQWSSQFPKGMDHEFLQDAPRVTQPVIQARLAESIVPRVVLTTAGRTEPARNLSAIHFDFKSQSFVGITHSTTGISQGVVVSHVNGGGVSFSGNSGSRSGYSGGGGSHGSSGGGGGSSSSGGGHSGGGSSSGGSVSSGGSGGGGGGHH